MNDSKDTQGAVKPRKLTQSQKTSRVTQAAGYRMALLEIWPLIKDEAVREEIRKRGQWADSQVAEYGGYLFSTFDQALENREAVYGNS